jgi:hypothetical protein
LAIKQPAKAPGQNSIGTGGQDSIGANKKTKAAASVPLISAPHLVNTLTPTVQAQAKVTQSISENRPSDEPAKRLICAHCGAKISYPEGKFCWNNAKRFGGLAYCREHQALI